MKFLRHLLGITKLDKEKNQCIRQKNGSTEHSKENKTVPVKVATARAEDGHKWNIKTSITISTKRRRNTGRPRKRWRTNFIWRIKKQETLLILHEHDYDDKDSSDGTVSIKMKKDRFLVTRFPRVARDLSLLRNFQNRYPAQQASYPVVSGNNSSRT